MDTLQYIQQLKRRAHLSKERDKAFFDALHEDLIHLDHELEEIRSILNIEDSTLEYISIELE